MIRRKNHETILKALSRLSGLSNIHYLLCGHGELESYLRNMAEALNISNMVTFAGYREDILQILQAADLFLFPSYQEGLPMALLEAMACGLPVICSDIRGSRDLMGDIQSQNQAMQICSGGIMVKKADDVSAWSEAIRHLLNNTGDFKKLGQENRKRSDLFGSEPVMEKMSEIYRRILSD